MEVSTYVIVALVFASVALLVLAFGGHGGDPRRQDAPSDVFGLGADDDAAWSFGGPSEYDSFGVRLFDED